MSAAIVGLVGTLIVAILIYVVSRIDRLGDKIEAQLVVLARIEGRLDEHLRAHP